MNKDLVVHSATLLKSIARLSAVELKLIILCTTKVRRDRGYELENRRFEITHKEFSELVKKDDCYSSMRAAVKRLRGRYISFNEPVTDNQGKTWDGEEINIMSSCRWLKDEGTVSVTINDEFMPFLTKLNGKYAKYLSTDIGELEGHYAIILFGLLRNHLNTQAKNKDKENLLVKMHDLRSFFVLEEKYKAHKDFKKWVLDSATDEINAKSPIFVEYSQLKKGRRIDIISFKVTEKSAPLSPKSKVAKRILEDIETIKRALEIGHIVTIKDKVLLAISGECTGDFGEHGTHNIFNILKGGAKHKIEQRKGLF